MKKPPRKVIMRLKDWFIKPSTRDFVNEARATPGYSFFDLVHGYVYARWPYLYIGIGTGEHPLSKWFALLSGWFNRLVTRRKRGESAHSHIHFADTYHGKAVTLEAAKSLVSIEAEIEIHDLEQVIP